MCAFLPFCATSLYVWVHTRKVDTLSVNGIKVFFCQKRQKKKEKIRKRGKFIAKSTLYYSWRAGKGTQFLIVFQCQTISNLFQILLEDENRANEILCL